MNKLQQIVAGYGVINIIGGVIGLVAGKSSMSLIVGGISGLILIGCAVIAKDKPSVGYRVAGGLTLALLIFWIMRTMGAMESGKIMMPAMNVVLAIGVLAILANAHFSAQKKKA